jgi:hypothetical protein
MLTLNTVGKGIGYFDAAILELRNIHVLKIGKLPGRQGSGSDGLQKAKAGSECSDPPGDFLLQFCQIGLVSFPFWNRSHAKAEITRAFPTDFSPWIKTLS